MQIADLLSPEGVVAALKVQGKKQLLQIVGAGAGIVHNPERRIYETLTERERLGTPAWARASPFRMDGSPTSTRSPASSCGWIRRSNTTPSTISRSIWFSCCWLRKARADHLKALARVSRLLRNQTACDKLRAAKSAEALYAILTEPASGTNSVAA